MEEFLKQEQEIKEKEKIRTQELSFKLLDNPYKNQVVSFSYDLTHAKINIKIMAIPHKYAINHDILKDYPKNIDNIIPSDIHDYNLDNILDINKLAHTITSELMDNLLPSIILVKLTRYLEDQQTTSAYATLKLPNFNNDNLENWLFSKI